MKHIDDAGSSDEENGCDKSEWGSTGTSDGHIHGELVHTVDEDDYDEGELDDEELESGGRCMLPVKVINETVSAQLDTAAQSVWVSHAWYRSRFGDPEEDDAPAFGADSSALDVTGRGKITFSIWGRVFHNQPVRVLRGLDVNVLIGLRFQRQPGFVLDVGRKRASFVVQGYEFKGNLLREMY